MHFKNVKNVKKSIFLSSFEVLFSYVLLLITFFHMFFIVFYMFNSNYYNHLQPFCSSVGLDKFSTILSSDVLSHWCATLPTPVNQMPSCEDVWRCVKSVTLTWWWQRTPMRKLKLESAKTLWPLESPIIRLTKKCERLQKVDPETPRSSKNHPRFPQQALDFVEVVVFARHDQLGNSGSIGFVLTPPGQATEFQQSPGVLVWHCL